MEVFPCCIPREEYVAPATIVTSRDGHCRHWDGWHMLDIFSIFPVPEHFKARIFLVNRNCLIVFIFPTADNVEERNLEFKME